MADKELREAAFEKFQSIIVTEKLEVLSLCGENFLALMNDLDSSS